MKRNIVILALIVGSVFSAYKSNGDTSLKRVKRQDDKWIWGFVSNTTESVTKSAITETTTEENPCERPSLQKPSFAAGRRISERKCHEYIWNIKFRETELKNSADCLEYMKRHPGPNGIPLFAIGGRGALPGEFPHMGAIGWKAAEGTWIFKCGGSLISEKFVLTAAHCTRVSDRDTTVADTIPKIIRFGDKNIVDVFSNDLEPKDKNISRIIVHPSYKSPMKYFDIALMELDSKLYFDSNVQPACLWPNSDTSILGKEATATGWGVVESAGRVTSPTLQVVKLDIIDTKSCDELLKPQCNRLWCGIRDTQICAGKLTGGVDTCRGDSGGPLQVKIDLPQSSEGAIYYVIGVTSFGFGCAEENTPGVYTRVSSFIDWIEDNVWNAK